MKALAFLTFLMVSGHVSADIISLDCDESFTSQDAKSWYEDGFDDQPEGRISFLYDSGYNTLMIDGEEVRIDKFKADGSVFIVQNLIDAKSSFSPGRSYEFDRSGEYDTDGILRIYEVGGFVGRVKIKEMICFLSED